MTTDPESEVAEVGTIETAAEVDSKEADEEDAETEEERAECEKAKKE